MLTYEEADSIGTITMGRAAKLNAFRISDWEELCAIVTARVDLSRTRALVLRSAVPKAFCAGSDLMEIARLAHDEGARSLFRIAMDSAMTAICQVPVPVVAEIDGACFGAGVALALSCDIRIAGEKARFGITPAKLGISYPYKDVARLYAAVGRGHASDLLFTAKTIDAEEARRIGLVERVVPDAQPATLTVARSSAANATESNAALKTMLVHCEGEFTEEFDRTFEAMFDRPAFHKRIGSL